VQAADPQAAQDVVTTYLANQANAQLSPDPLDYRRSSRHSSRSMTCGSSPPKTAQARHHAAHFLRRTGTRSTLAAQQRPSVRYSLIFVGSAILLIVHIPLLDRAERSRKEFLVGGTAPPWYGPA
jgi:hypothetical protein